MSKRGLVVVIPAYNEAKNISKVVSSIPATLQIEKDVFVLSVVVVDDASKDATFECVQSTKATVLRHVINSGAGAATRTGMQYVLQKMPKAEYVVTIDADGQHATDDIRKMLDHAVRHNAPFVVGNRLHAGNDKHMPLHRTLGNKGLSFISRVLFGIKTKDTQSGLRLLHQSVLRDVASYSIDRYGFCTEMLWIAVRNKIRIDEVPISVKYSDETIANGQNSWGVVDLLLDLFWIRISR